MGLCVPLSDSHLKNCKLEEHGMIAFNPINALMTTYDTTKTDTLTINLLKPAEEENSYVHFGYGPLTN